MGAKIYELLSQRDDLEFLIIDPDKRRDVEERKKFLNAADLVLLCLPEDTARETIPLVENPNTRILDTSPAHRTEPGWVYGFAELLPGQRQRIRFSKRVSNPGCHASGFLSTVAPLVKLGILPPDYPVSCFSITGYSGGGKEMIAEFQDPDRDPALACPSLYSLGLRHNHLNEMQHIAGLTAPPVFTPILSDMYSGMSTSVPLQNRLLADAGVRGPLREPGSPPELRRLRRQQPPGDHRMRTRGTDPAHRPVRQPGQGGGGRRHSKFKPDAGL